MNKNFYSIIKLLLDVIIEKNLPPTFSARTLFILPATVIVGLGSVLSNIKLFDNYNYKYEHIRNKEYSCKELDLLIIYLSLKALELINRDIESKLIKEYLSKNNVEIKFIDTNTLQNIVYEMIYYYNQRNKDGWKDSNKQIKLPNDNYININQPLNSNNFMDPISWCPLQGQKMLGSKWGNVVGILSESKIKKINDYLDIKFRSVDIKLECKEVLDKSLCLTDKEKMVAEFWAGIGGTVTPPGFFNMFLYGYFKSNPKSNRIQLEYFYQLSTGLFQASIIVWGMKYKFLQCRPIQSIRLNYPGIPIDYYFGDSNTSVWKPYQESRLWTPPFPDYISGHSTFSSTAACILTKLLGSNLSNLNINLSNEEMLMLSPIFESNQFGNMNISDIIIQPDSSKIQKSVPNKEVHLIFDTWESMAESAGISRIYGGIHYPSSNTIALQVGKMVCKNLLQ